MRCWLLGAGALFAVGLATGGVITGRPLFPVAAWTFASLPIVYLVVAAVRGRVARPAGTGIAAELVVVVSASTVIALISCGQRLEPASDLAGCDLTGLELAGLDLSRSDLTDADLSGVNLRRTRFDGANLSQADLSEAQLDRTSLVDANLEGADLRNVDLTRAILPPASLAGTTLDGADLHDVDLVSVSLVGATARGANMTGTNLSDADMTGVTLDGATLDGATLLGTRGLSDEALAQALGASPEDLGGRLTQAEIRLELRDDILESLGQACLGRRVQGTTAYPQGSFHPTVILDDRGQYGSDTDRASDLGWEPMAARFAQLVACVGEQEQAHIESCPYSGEGKFATISRVQNHRDFRVVEAATGKTVLQKSFEGTLPKPCPTVHFFSNLQLNETFAGSSIGFGKVQAEIAGLVE